MKVAIIHPPALEKIRNDKNIISRYFPSSGINYIFELLKKNKINCQFFDFYFDNWRYVSRKMALWKFDVIGITCLTYGRVNTFKMIEIIREYNKDAIIVLGGFHATYMAEQILENYDVDYIVLGEGEIKMLSLIEYLNGDRKIENVDGLAYKENGKVIIIPERSYNKHLDDLPFPFSTKNSQLTYKPTTIEQVNPLLAKYLSPEERKYKYIMILTSRGCPYNCQFCSSTKFWGHKWRYRSVTNVVDEIEFYYKKFGIKYFEFIDDAFTINQERAIQICVLIHVRGLNIKFNCRTRANSISFELAYWLKKTGCLAVGLGVESGSEKILKNINKNIKIKTIIKAFETFKEYDIIAYPFIMVGNPGETRETIKETIDLLRIINPKFMAVSITTIYPGSDLYELAKSQGFISDDYWLTDKFPPYYTHEHSLKQLDKWSFKVMNCNKSRFVRIIHLIFKKYPFTLKLYRKLRGL